MNGIWTGLLLAAGFLLCGMFACEDPNFKYNESWDHDNDGALEAADFYSGVDVDEFYAAWDVDADSSLSAHEFIEGIEEYGLFREWDIDNDRELNQPEFNMAFASDELLAQWDSDRSGRLDRNELYTGLLSELDDDADGALVAEEFDRGGERF